MDQLVRRAQQKDIPRVVELGEEFATLSQPIHGFSVSREMIIVFANTVVNDDQCVGFVLEVDGEVQGFIAGVIEKIFFSKDIALQEVAWYVKKGYRGIELLFAFEACGKTLGVTQVIVGNKPQYYDLQKFYLRQGFKLLENQYIKRLN